MREFESRLGPNRQRFQAGFPSPPRITPMPTPGALHLRGVVVATYIAETVNELLPGAVYCDVLVISNVPAIRGRVIPKALVMQPPGSGLQRGNIWKPRAASQTINGDTFTPLSPGINPAETDGDFVLVGFMDDLMNQPVILGSLPHPSRDIGHDNDEAGHRMRLTVTDGDPSFVKHHGSFYGVNNEGDFVIDTTKAHDGSLLPDGAEPPHSAGGDVAMRLPDNGTLKITVGEGTTLELQNAEGETLMTLGNGAEGVALGQPLQQLWTQLIQWLTQFATTHTHTSTAPSNPTSPPIPPPGPAPSFDPAIISTHLKVPGE